MIYIKNLQLNILSKMSFFRKLWEKIQSENNKVYIQNYKKQYLF